jgi:cell division protein ZapA
MPVLRININGRDYDITCEKNKEKYVLELSKYFDQKVKDFSVKLKNVDHSRLLVLTGILLSEELNNIMKDKSKVDNPYGKNYKLEVEDLKQKQSEASSIVKNKIDKLISRIQSLTK